MTGSLLWVWREKQWRFGKSAQLRKSQIKTFRKSLIQLQIMFSGIPHHAEHDSGWQDHFYGFGERSSGASGISLTNFKILHLSATASLSCKFKIRCHSESRPAWRGISFSLPQNLFRYNSQDLSCQTVDILLTNRDEGNPFKQELNLFQLYLKNIISHVDRKVPNKIWNIALK